MGNIGGSRIGWLSPVNAEADELQKPRRKRAPLPLPARAPAGLQMRLIETYCEYCLDLRGKWRLRQGVTVYA